MKADNLSFLRYRNYDWKRMQCITLFRDIESIAMDENRKSHYVGFA